METKNLVGLFDGDMMAYVASSSVQKDIDWGDGLWTCHSYLDDAIEAFESLLSHIDLEINYGFNIVLKDPIFFFSDKINFRKLINPEYKSNRIGMRKPVAYNPLVDYIQKNYQYKINKYCEADDSISMATEDYKDSIIISGDKDFKTVPGLFYDFKRLELVDTSKDEAEVNLFVQALTGDRADGYLGCPKYGPVKSKKLIDSCEPNFDSRFNSYVNAYLNEGLTIHDALINYDMAKLLTKEKYEGLEEYLKYTYSVALPK